MAVHGAVHFPLLEASGDTGLEDHPRLGVGVGEEVAEDSLGGVYFRSLTNTGRKTPNRFLDVGGGGEWDCARP